MSRLSASGIPGFDLEQSGLCWSIQNLDFGKILTKRGWQGNSSSETLFPALIAGLAD
jgi:hypothetical protein